MVRRTKIRENFWVSTYQFGNLFQRIGAVNDALPIVSAFYAGWINKFSKGWRFF
jgi:hypothetical protein